MRLHTTSVEMSQQISDDEVVYRVRSGDLESYGVLATRYHATLCRVARRMLHSDADAEDAVQGAHVLAITHLHQCSEGSNDFRWMYSIVVNEARTQVRKGRRKAKVLAGATYPNTAISQMRGPEQQVLDRDAKEILDAAVESLPADYKPVFRYREMHELSTAETGERLGLSGACVKTRLFRAKIRLRTKLKELLQEADLGRPARDCAAAVPSSRFGAPEVSNGARKW